MVSWYLGATPFTWTAGIHWNGLSAVTPVDPVIGYEKASLAMKLMSLKTQPFWFWVLMRAHNV